MIGFCLVGSLHAEPATPAQPERAAPNQGEAAEKSPGQSAEGKEAEDPDVAFLHWYGIRPRLEADGITFKGNLTADYSKNLMGGVHTSGDAFRDLLDLRMTLDTRALVGVPDGTVSVDFQNQNGRNGSTLLTGDFQRFDNIDADGRTQISELWYQQILFDQKLRIKVGKVDASTEFDATAGAASFLNSSFGFAPTIFLLPTYPDPAMSVNLFFNPKPWVYGGVGVYDGSAARGVATGSYGPKFFFNGPGDYFFIAEVGGRWAMAHETLPGHFGIGAWYDNADLPRFDGGRSAGTSGFFAVGEQTLWHLKKEEPTDPVGIAGFLQYGYADSHVSPIWQYVGGGVTWTGPIPSQRRRDDSLGISFAYAGFSSSAGAGFTRDYELSVEAFYGIQVRSYLLVKPDLQYIVNPGGRGAHDALAATARIVLTF
jgi:porin